MKDQLPPEVLAGVLEEMRLRFEAGEKDELISAIRLCGHHKLVMPEWVVDALFQGTNKWYALELKSLDEALGVAWPKGKSVAAEKKRRRLQFIVLNAVAEARSRGVAIDDELFEEIGKNLKPPIGKTLVKSYYHSARQIIGSNQRQRHRQSRKK